MTESEKYLAQLLKENLLPGNLQQVSPFDIVNRWLEEATQLAWQPNPNSMLLSTIKSVQTEELLDEHGDQQLKISAQPDARVVLCKEVNTQQGFVTFYTNYQSVKGQQLNLQAFATAVFHWDNLGRQVRISGEVIRAPMLDSEAYFNSRHPLSKLGTWASDQSRPIATRQELLDKLEFEKQRYAEAGENIPRPPHWGGYRLWATQVECWLAHPGRIHDRAVWSREVSDRQKDELHFTAWEVTRLQP